MEGMPSLRTDPPPPGTHLLGDRPTVLLRLQTPGAGLGAAHRGLPWQPTHVRAGTLTLDQHRVRAPVLCTDRTRALVCNSAHRVCPPNNAGHKHRPMTTQAPTTQPTVTRTRVPTVSCGAGTMRLRGTCCSSLVQSTGPHPTRHECTHHHHTKTTSLTDRGHGHLLHCHPT